MSHFSNVHYAMMQQQQTQQQMQMQQQQQQQQIVGVGNQQMGGLIGAPTGGPNVMLQQQQQQHQHQQQQQHLMAQAAVAAGVQQSTMATGNLGSMQQSQQLQTMQHGGPTTTPTGNNMLAVSQSNSHKEINIFGLSRLGQETVQDITSRFQEIFAALKIIQPTCNRDNNTEKKVQEHFRTIRLLFKRMRIIYEKCNDGYPQGIEYTHIESLIPYKDEQEHRNEPPQSEEHRKALQENQELIETVKLKNRQIREIIDRTRIIIWEINTMLNMRRS